MEKIIKAAVERGASDLHIKAGDVFRARINGKLVALTKQRLTPDQTKAIALKLIASDEDRAKIDRLRDFDCSWGMPGVGRFRVNVLRQRSSFMIVMRVIPFTVPTIESLRLPEVLKQIAEVRPGAGAGFRGERQRKELHRGGHGAPHQPHPAQARGHHREPDRVSPPRPELLHHPAGSRGGHRKPRHRAPGGAAPGSGRGGSRRNGRCRHHRHRAQGGRDRPPGHRHHAPRPTWSPPSSG